MEARKNYRSPKAYKAFSADPKYKIRIKPAGGRYKFYSAGWNAAKFLAKKLLCDKTYYWNVKAKGNKRTTLDSAWANSGVDKSFTTQLPITLNS